MYQISWLCFAYLYRASFKLLIKVTGGPPQRINDPLSESFCCKGKMRMIYSWSPLALGIPLFL